MSNTGEFADWTGAPDTITESLTLSASIAP